MTTVEKVKTALNPGLKVDGGIVTMFDARINLANQVKNEIFNYYGDRVYKTVIPRNVRLAEAPSFGQAIFVYDPSSRGACAYYDLGIEFLVRRGADPKLFEGAKRFIPKADEDFDLGG